MNTDQQSFIIWLMGVSGCGKTTVGNELANLLQVRSYDADDFHPAANVEKMSAGISLQDEDRWPWLEDINRFVKQKEQKGESILFACSALKESYRQCLMYQVESPNYWFYLQGDFDTLKERLENRKAHYMPASLLQSQLDVLEIPDYAHVISIDQDVASMVRQIEKILDSM